LKNMRVLVFLGAAAIAVAFFAFDLGRFLTVDFLKSQQAEIDAFYRAQPFRTIFLYSLLYIAVTALSLPGAAIMTLAGGAIFGVVVGTLVVSFASTIGATLAFLASRFVFRDWVQDRFGDSIKIFNQGMEKDGASYLFTLRLVPIFPFFLINLVMGLTPIPAWQFYWVSQIGMLAGTLVYVNAGSQIAQIDTIRGLISPGLLLAFVLLGMLPWIARKGTEIVRARRVLTRWPKPTRFDRNLIVIGAGSAGLVSAYIASTVKAKVTLVEQAQMGGDCLNTGCVPSKALIRSAKFLSQVRRASEFGIREATAHFDFADVMQRVQRVIRSVAPHDSVERYTALGVECLAGKAKITSPYSVEIAMHDGSRRTLTSRAIIIAVGAEPWVPPIPGMEEIGYYTSASIWSLRQLPKRMVVLGGGPVGCELAQCFARLGAKVTVVEMAPRLLIREDPEISERLMDRFRTEGIEILTEHRATRFLTADEDRILIAEHRGGDVRMPFDALLCALGRSPRLTGYGLEELGIPVTTGQSMAGNEYLQTLYPNIYACGDVVGPYQFTHTAAHQAWYAAVNALFGGFLKFKADYSVIPWCTFTDPEVAHVGLNEQEAREKKAPYEVTRYCIDDLDRAITDEEAHGVVKVLTMPGKDTILGATIVGERAGDLIGEFVLAMKHGLGLNKILGTIHVYPTLSEANKYAAGLWKREHTPQRLLSWVARYHTWRRG